MPEAYPALETLADPHGGRVGHTAPVTAAFVIGRAPEVDLTVASPLVGRRHCRIEQRYGRWWLLELAGSDGVFHNGARVANAELLHLDTIALPSGHVFRFLAHAEPSITDAALERAIAEAPDDDSRWAVYADWLFEQGAALGERMLAPRPEGDGRWLGALARPWALGNLEVQWHRGLPRRLVLRQLSRAVSTGWQRALEAVARDPTFRFLRAVEIDLESLLVMSPGEDVRAHDRPLAALLDQLGPAELPLLESITVGPMTLPLAAEQALEALERLRTSRPRLATGSPFFSSGPAFLEVLSSPRGVAVTPAVGERVRLDPSASSLIGMLPECVVRIDAPPGHPARVVAVRLSLVDGRWVLEDLFARSRPYREPDFALTVNRREIVDALLRPGDVMELASGLLVRFGADRA